MELNLDSTSQLFKKIRFKTKILIQTLEITQNEFDAIEKSRHPFDEAKVRQAIRVLDTQAPSDGTAKSPQKEPESSSPPGKYQISLVSSK